MLDKEKHQLLLGRILKDIYTDISIAALLGLKGGTCARLFYDLPRFSVDLDFDLFEQDGIEPTAIREAVHTILENYGRVKESRLKRYTIFLLLTYGAKDRNIKVEINLRSLIPNLERHYEPKKHLGISMWVGKQPYLFASKLAALTDRSQIAMRDVYDIWFYANRQWDIDPEVIRIRTGKSVADYLADCIDLIEGIKDSQILQGMGELLGQKEKDWARNNLRREVIFLLRNYRAALM